MMVKLFLLILELWEDIIQNFLRHAVRDGFFHADMHQGNIFIDNDGQIVPIDFGIMGRYYSKFFKTCCKRWFFSC